MGNARFDSSAYTMRSTAATQGKSTAQVFTSRGMPESLDPLKFTNGLRESVDSPANPNSTPIALFCDQTGSMGMLADQIIRTSMGPLVKELYDRKPVTDPHILVGGIGDAYNHESAPLQASQFEAGADPILEQLKLLYLEGNGGGNGGESYSLAHLFAWQQTSIDSFSKRGEKGFLFTLGDEPIHGAKGGYGGDFGVTKDQAKRYLGLDIERDLTAEEIYAGASAQWNIYHIDVRDKEQPTWRNLLGDHFIKIPSVDLLAEVIVSTIQIATGADKKTVVSSWGGGTDIVLSKALGGLPSVAGAAAGSVARL